MRVFRREYLIKSTRSRKERLDKKVKFLKHVFLFKELDEDMIENYTFLIEEVHLHQNQYLYKRGQKVKYLYIINQGEFEEAAPPYGDYQTSPSPHKTMTSPDKLSYFNEMKMIESKTQISRASPGNLCGDVEIYLKRSSYSSSIKCISQSAIVFRLLLNDFKFLLSLPSLSTIFEKEMQRKLEHNEQLMLSEEKFDQIQKASFDEKISFPNKLRNYLKLNFLPKYECNNDNKVIYQNIKPKGAKSLTRKDLSQHFKLNPNNNARLFHKKTVRLQENIFAKKIPTRSRSIDTVGGKRSNLIQTDKIQLKLMQKHLSKNPPTSHATPNSLYSSLRPKTVHLPSYQEKYAPHDLLNKDTIIKKNRIELLERKLKDSLKHQILYSISPTKITEHYNAVSNLNGIRKKIMKKESLFLTNDSIKEKDPKKKTIDLSMQEISESRESVDSSKEQENIFKEISLKQKMKDDVILNKINVDEYNDMIFYPPKRAHRSNDTSKKRDLSRNSCQNHIPRIKIQKSKKSKKSSISKAIIPNAKLRAGPVYLTQHCPDQILPTSGYFPKRSSSLTRFKNSTNKFENAQSDKIQEHFQKSLTISRMNPGKFIDFKEGRQALNFTKNVTIFLNQRIKTCQQR
ncbi:unnamed protein product [Moneuplotes crassus]|uniref:Cyclic nucleotide-binding domain-containing protein n=1 Tax=Euplotes crassus TaxID=5936 RepID=A0AAD1Y3W8_EUPCR|nr:unnamed protein product [Moneuplotes crassus]